MKCCCAQQNFIPRAYKSLSVSWCIPNNPFQIFFEGVRLSAAQADKKHIITIAIKLKGIFIMFYFLDFINYFDVQDKKSKSLEFCPHAPWP